MAPTNHLSLINFFAAHTQNIFRLLWHQKIPLPHLNVLPAIANLTRRNKSVSSHDTLCRPVSILIFYLLLEGNWSLQVPTIRGWVSPRESIQRSVWEEDHPETCPEWNTNRSFRNTPRHCLSCSGFMSDLKYGCLQALELCTGLTCARHKRKYCFCW
jgi:hypothetical protein